MKRCEIYLYRTAAGLDVVGNTLATLAKSSPSAFSAIQSGVQMLEEFGLQPGLNRFKQLRHVEGGVSLWEIRAQGKPAYRVLFAPVPGEDAFVLLDAIRKDDMAKGSAKYIDRALEWLDHWLADVHRAEGGA